VPLVEVDVNGVVQAVNTFGAAGLVSRRTGGVNGPTTFYTFDPQGNVCQRLDSTAMATSTDMADAFGTVYRAPSLGVRDVFSFGGQWGYYHDWDGGANLWLLTNRYYDPGLGRFVTADPIGNAGGGNRYRFVGNNPTVFADPLGLVERGQYVGGGAALGGAAGVAIGAPSVGGSVFLGGLLGTYGGMVGGSLYDSADDFGTAYGCYESGRASGWQAAWAGAKAFGNVVSTVVFIKALASGASPGPGGGLRTGYRYATAAEVAVAEQSG
jgi:RHS repeat-associated protein